MITPHTIVGRSKEGREFFEQVKFLCLGQRVDDVFVVAVAMLMSAVQQRTDSKDEAVAMMQVTGDQMIKQMKSDYDLVSGECDGAQFNQ